MSDIVARLRELEPSMTVGADCKEAADEIERLRGEKELLAKMMIRQSFSTGHGDTLEDLVKELEPQISGLRAERDALLALLTEVRCYVEQDDSGLSRKGKADMELLDRIDAARKGEA
jgi:hypothetical protein